MKIGLLLVQLRLPGCHSLKEKRSRVKRQMNQIRKKYNVAAAELTAHDYHHHARLGFVTLNNGSAPTERTMDLIVEYLEGCGDFQLEQVERELF